MDTKREHNILVALSRAVEVEEDLTLRRVLSELIIERYPESIHGWAYRAKNDPLKLNNTDALRERLSDMYLSLKALASSKEKGMEVDRSIFAWASDICADIFADREDFKAVIEVLEKVPEVAPQKHASVRWKIVAALIALNRTSEARKLASEKVENRYSRSVISPIMRFWRLWLRPTIRRGWLQSRELINATHISQSF
jgi:hypothetical protein